MVHLLRRDVIGLCPHVDLLIDVHTGYDEEDAWPAGAAGEEAAQAEDDGALVLLQERPGHRGAHLHHLHRQAQGEGQGHEDEQHRDDHNGVSADSLALLASWWGLQRL